MKLYINTKKMTFEEDNIEHDIIVSVIGEKCIGYDLEIDLPDNDKFIKETLKIFYKKDKDNKDIDKIEYKMFITREQETWNSFPLYEIIDEEIVPFDYTKYGYFSRTDRRVALGKKVSTLYNLFSEMKIHRKALKRILENLGIADEGFEKYNDKIEEIINKNPKN